MRKKLLAAMLSTAMVASMASVTMVQAEEKDPSEVKVGLVLDVGGVNDGSFNQTSWEGLQKAVEDFGVQGTYLESNNDADYAANIDTFLDEEYDLIIGVGYMLADGIRAAAEENPDVKFAIIDDSTNADLDNVTCLMFKQEQCSYLVGTVAGKMTKANNVGIVLGMATETMHQFGYGYVAGVLDTNPECEIQQMNANSFANAEIGKADANAMITNGADIIYQVAGGTGRGVIEACDEADGVYAIGVDTDQAPLAPETVITSAMKRVDTSVYDSVDRLLKGELESGIVVYDLASDGVGIAPTQDLLPEDVIAAVNEAAEKIKSGEIVVPSSKEEFDEKYGDDAYSLDVE
ncbi:MAG: BMP family ABC transporter substrate-binding protein [Eubacteriales bacterium]|nr:BMP family ABC transporter substrate-binding protein [Eubacteriales bacterium]